MRAAIVLLVMAAALVLLAACSGSSSGSAPTTTLPGDLVPSSASDATVTVTAGGTTRSVDAGTVGQVVPLLVRRVFDPAEPLASYGLDQPRADITFTEPGGVTTVLHVGNDDFDQSAVYLQREGDPRVWLVLASSIRPLLGD